jgi:hypothetical protein
MGDDLRLAQVSEPSTGGSGDDGLVDGNLPVRVDRHRDDLS